MKSLVWFYLFIIQTNILLIILALFLLTHLIPIKIEKADIVDYVNINSVNYSYKPEVGYVHDARTAKIIGTNIINDLFGNSRFRIGFSYVVYDEENRLWRIGKVYLPGGGGIVVIKQDNGEVIYSELYK